MLPSHQSVPAIPATGITGGEALRLRPTHPSDLPTLFELQSDAESNAMAGTKPRTREEFMAVWDGIFANPRITSRVIEIDGPGGFELAGGVSCFQVNSEAVEGSNSGGGALNCVGYWVARPHWGKGIASSALEMFLHEERRRPLHATAARANVASCRILEKCGFRCVGFKVGEETPRFVRCEIADFVLE